MYLIAQPTTALFVKNTAQIVFLLKQAVKDVRGVGWHQSAAHNDNEHGGGGVVGTKCSVGEKRKLSSLHLLHMFRTRLHSIFMFTVYSSFMFVSSSFFLLLMAHLRSHKLTQLDQRIKPWPLFKVGNFPWLPVTLFHNEHTYILI